MKPPGSAKALASGTSRIVEGEEDVGAAALAGHLVTDPVDAGEEGVLLDEAELEGVGPRRLQADLEVVRPGRERRERAGSVPARAPRAGRPA